MNNEIVHADYFFFFLVTSDDFSFLSVYFT